MTSRDLEPADQPPDLLPVPAPADHPPDLLPVPIPVGGRVLVVSDLLLRPGPAAPALAATRHLATVLDAWDGPGAVVVAGNLFDLSGPEAPDLEATLDGHGELVRAMGGFAGEEGRRLVCLPGNRDRRLAWDADLAGQLRRRLGAELALVVELEVETGAGRRRVRVDPGQRFDPSFRVGDPANPAESPIGQHMLEEVLPGLARSRWATDADRLADPASLLRFVVSRSLYRGAARHAWWLVVPIVLALAIKFPVTYGLLRHPAQLVGSAAWDDRALVLGITTLFDMALVGLAAAWLARRGWARLGRQALSPPAAEVNEAARAEGRRLVTEGYAGFIIGHTLRAEMTQLGPGFFAATGAVAEVVEEHQAWLGLPAVFLGRVVASWVELEAGAELHVHLSYGAAAVPGASLVERLVARHAPPARTAAAVVASYPRGRDWPEATDTGVLLRRHRRIAAVALGAGGLVDFLSAVTPPLRARLDDVHAFVPLSVSRAADAVVSLGGLALLFLARGVRGGQRRAWAVACAVLAASVILNVVKGGDLEEAAFTLAILGYLLLRRDSFAGSADRASLRLIGSTLVGAAAAGFILAVGALELTLQLGRHTHPLGVGPAIEAVGGRLVGDRLVALPHRIDLFMTPALEAVTFGFAVAALWLAFRPVVQRQEHRAPAVARARSIISRFGLGTLDYFALRNDKELFFFGDTLVAYGVYGGVCLVSPDPIGPESERSSAWDAFRRLAYSQGWSLGVLGAGESWLPIYRASGMRDMYVGDEAVLDVRVLDLSGGKNKGLRQAVNRVAKYGYTISFHDPARLDPDLRAGVAAVMTQSRQGDVERGFSMTLGRIFDAQDRGLLLAVASDPSGKPVAFCQYVPAPGINGYSLDLMRRDEGEHPNGLIDFVVVETARHLKEQGMVGLGLNFATMRAVLAGEAGEGLTQRVERWALKRMSGSMQIESLWKFNAKFDPRWQPRFLVYDAAEHLLPIAMAMARAESFWELPLVGRFLVPSSAGSTEQPG